MTLEKKIDIINFYNNEGLDEVVKWENLTPDEVLNIVKEKNKIIEEYKKKHIDENKLLTNAYDELISTLTEINKTVDDIEGLIICVSKIRNIPYDLLLGFERFTVTSVDELDSLKDVLYDQSYGSEVIDGYVVFTDGTWLERESYDGSEWWTYKSVDDIRNKIKSKICNEW